MRYQTPVYDPVPISLTEGLNPLAYPMPKTRLFVVKFPKKKKNKKNKNWQRKFPV